ncbi:Uncharacterized protein Fot_05408 [Forsythia ovata]|uniref:Uncharacterized protein n=1 Tax=Forsythia ovata TaxID=205694 RepID=A0ABD1WQ14_9LAMI
MTVLVDGFVSPVILGEGGGEGVWAILTLNFPQFVTAPHQLIDASCCKCCPHIGKSEVNDFKLSPTAQAPSQWGAIFSTTEAHTVRENVLCEMGEMEEMDLRERRRRLAVTISAGV